ncbi:MAG: hypothetical protein A2Z74_03950 [Chloroflexi bacterium RBG_13_46_9]|nr:MAG: hypothetical protein A2Z74_03950 [Chloroflexi bacterium RBG_13_46_9]
MKFENEEKRIEAMKALDPLASDSESKLVEIQAAEIGEDKPIETPTPEVKPEPIPVTDGKPAEVPIEEPALTKWEITDLKGHKKPEELLKSYDNAQDKIANDKIKMDQQAEKIKELSTQQANPELQQRLERAERELAELKRSTPQQAKETAVDMKALQIERQKAFGVIKELKALVEKDPEVVFEKSYQQKMLDAQEVILNNTIAYDAMFEKLSSEVADTRRVHSEFVTQQTQGSQKQKEGEQIEAFHKEMDAIDDPEYKTTKPYKELMDSYLKWRDDVCVAYYGRLPKSNAEANHAMDQLELRNPKILQECNLRNIPIEHDDDTKKFILKTELNLFRQGYRKNLATGHFNEDRRVMVPDGKGGEVPYVIPTIKEALEVMRAESGYYKEKVNGAYQQGATDFARATERRDQGAVTLDGGDQKGTTKTEAWAHEFLAKVDPDRIRDAMEKGRTAELAEYYEAMKLVGTPVT